MEQKKKVTKSMHLRIFQEITGNIIFGVPYKCQSFIVCSDLTQHVHCCHLPEAAKQTTPDMTTCIKSTAPGCEASITDVKKQQFRNTGLYI